MSDRIIEEQEMPSQTSLRDLCYIFFRHKWKLILFFLAVVVCVAVLTFYSAETYRSQASLMVRLGRESVTLDPTATTGQIIPVAQSRESEVQAELEILKSREIAEKVVDSIGPQALLKRPAKEPLAEPDARGPIKVVKQKAIAVIIKLRDLLKKYDVVVPVADRDKAVLTVMKNLEIGIQRDSSIIGVSYGATDPNLAQQVLAKLIEFYLEKHIAIHQTPGSYPFFTEQSEHLRARVAQFENELQDLKNKTGISSLQEQQRVILERIGTLETEIDRAEAGLASSQARVQSLRQSLATIPQTVVTASTTGFGNYGADMMRDRLYALQLREQDLASKYTDESRQLQEVRRQIAEAQELLSKEQPLRTQVTNGLNVAHQQVEAALLTEQAALVSYQAEVDALRARLASAKTELRTLNESGIKINALMREIEIQQENYRKYSGNLEQARIDQALQTERISNISVVQSATLPMKPYRPQKVLRLLLGLLLGVFGGIGLVFLCAYLDHSIKTPEEAEERLQLPALASIPRAHADRVHPAGWFGKKAKQWVVPKKVREQYNVFRERLLLQSKRFKEAPRVLAVTGSHPGEGVSTVAANLAAVLARAGDGKVLLIDANLGHPSVHRIFRQKLAPGLIDVLKDGQTGEEAIIPSPVQNLDILSAGTANGDPSGIFSSGRLPSFLDSAKKDYRFVVIDLPTVNQASWAVRLASLCDGVALVVEAERSRREVAQRVKEQLLNSRAKVLGIVINKRRFRIPGWLYHRL
jgi:capsular exopolysaccharide synthesis family protein